MKTKHETPFKRKLRAAAVVAAAASMGGPFWDEVADRVERAEKPKIQPRKLAESR